MQQVCSHTRRFDCNIDRILYRDTWKRVRKKRSIGDNRGKTRVIADYADREEQSAPIGTEEAYLRESANLSRRARERRVRLYVVSVQNFSFRSEYYTELSWAARHRCFPEKSSRNDYAGERAAWSSASTSTLFFDLLGGESFFDRMPAKTRQRAGVTAVILSAKTQPVITFDVEIPDRDVCPNYARITDCRLARLLLVETHERPFSRSRVYPWKCASPGVVRPLRRRSRGTEGGGRDRLFSTFMNFWCIATVFGARNDFQKSALRYYAKRREEISLERFPADKRFSL